MALLLVMSKQRWRSKPGIIRGEPFYTVINDRVDFSVEKEFSVLEGRFSSYRVWAHKVGKPRSWVSRKGKSGVGIWSFSNAAFPTYPGP